MSGTLIAVIAYCVNIAVAVATDGGWKTAGNSVAHFCWRISDQFR
jgi:hypothetical protein